MTACSTACTPVYTARRDIERSLFALRDRASVPWTVTRGRGGRSDTTDYLALPSVKTAGDRVYDAVQGHHVILSIARSHKPGAAVRMDKVAPRVYELTSPAFNLIYGRQTLAGSPESLSSGPTATVRLRRLSPE